LTGRNFHVIAGTSGGGKSTLIGALGELGYSVMPESALSVLQQQEQRSASPLSKANLQSFMEEVLERSIRAYDAAQLLTPPVFFERALAECLEHMRLLNLEIKPEFEAWLELRRYGYRVRRAAVAGDLRSGPLAKGRLRKGIAIVRAHRRCLCRERLWHADCSSSVGRGTSSVCSPAHSGPLTAKSEASRYSRQRSLRLPRRFRARPEADIRIAGGVTANSVDRNGPSDHIIRLPAQVNNVPERGQNARDGTGHMLLIQFPRRREIGDNAGSRA